MWIRTGLVAFGLSLSACVSASNDDYQMPLKGAIVQGYGETDNGFHHGINIEAKGGSPVRATMSGRVLKRGKSKSVGKYVVIDHGAGVQSTYASLSRISVNRGADIRRGQTIGRVGKRGEPAHLHFQMRVAKQSIDPVPILMKEELASARKASSVALAVSQ